MKKNIKTSADPVTQFINHQMRQQMKSERFSQQEKEMLHNVCDALSDLVNLADGYYEDYTKFRQWLEENTL